MVAHDFAAAAAAVIRSRPMLAGRAAMVASAAVVGERDATGEP